MVESDRENHARYGEVAGSLVGPCFTKLPDPRDHPVFQIVQRCADLQSAGQLVRLEPRTLAVVVATTGRLRADVAGNRIFFYRVHQGLCCLLARGRFSL